MTYTLLGGQYLQQFATNRKYHILFTSKPIYILPDKEHKKPRPTTSHHKKIGFKNHVLKPIPYFYVNGCTIKLCVLIPIIHNSKALSRLQNAFTGL